MTLPPSGAFVCPLLPGGSTGCAKPLTAS
jgi:hypothetical protein